MGKIVVELKDGKREVKYMVSGAFLEGQNIENDVIMLMKAFGFKEYKIKRD